jgi:NTE family protein
VTFTSGPLVDALTASMAFPGVFSPVRVENRLLADGGMVRNLPAQDALALGADVLVCSDVSDPLARAEKIATLFDVVNQAITLFAEPTRRAERARCDVLIEPDIAGRNLADFTPVEDWIARGRAAATLVRARLDSLARVGTLVPRRVAAPAARWIVALDLPGADSAHARLVRRRLNLRLPGHYGPDDIGEAMDRLYAAREFEEVSYVLEPAGDSAVRLVIRSVQPGVATLGFGLRYEATYKASLLLTAEFTDRLGAGTLSTLEARLGEQAHALASHERRIGMLTPWAVRLAAGYRRVPVDIYDASRRIAQGRFHIVSGSLFFGVASGTSALGGVVVTAEHARATVATGTAPGDTVREHRSFHTLGASLRVDTRDAPEYPRGGLLVVARADFADPAIASNGRFNQQVARVEGAIPVGPVSLLLRAEAGMSHGAELPPHYRFFLGGAVPFSMLPDRHRPFLGWRVQERSGAYYQVVGAGVQVALPAGLVTQLRWNAGTVREDGVLEPSAWRQGVAATLAARTSFGTFAGHLAGEPTGTYRAEVDLGFAF